MTDEDRHADEVNIAFQMGAEWQKKQNDSAWKGICEGAVLAMQGRINELERELEQEKQSRKVAAEKAWEFADRIKKLEALVKELLRSNWDNSWPTMRKYDTFEEYQNAVLGENNADA